MVQPAEDTALPVEVLYEGKWLRMCRRGRWEYAERTHAEGMAVIVIALTPDDRVLFVEQTRVPIGAKTIEMPAGLVGDQPGEDTLEDAARRELEEETGWRAAEVEVLLVGPTSSGMSSEQVAFVRARGLEKVGAGGGDASEDITVHEVPRAEAPAWLMHRHAEGYALDMKLWAGLWMLEREPDGTPCR
jgi:ADP-ribose pyrophosphatase